MPTCPIELDPIREIFDAFHRSNVIFTINLIITYFPHQCRLFRGDCKIFVEVEMVVAVPNELGIVHGRTNIVRIGQRGQRTAALFAIVLAASDQHHSDQRQEKQLIFHDKKFLRRIDSAAAVVGKKKVWSRSFI